MNIGLLTKQTDGTLHGDLPSMNLRGVSFEPVTKKGKGPDYRASIEGAELGAGWLKTSSKGKQYISAQIDAPYFSAPVYVAIFATKTDGTYAVAWSRREASDEVADTQDESESQSF